MSAGAYVLAQQFNSGFIRCIYRLLHNRHKFSAAVIFRKVYVGIPVIIRSVAEGNLRRIFAVCAIRYYLLNRRAFIYFRRLFSDYRSVAVG